MKTVRTFEDSKLLKVTWVLGGEGDQPRLVITRPSVVSSSGKNEILVLSADEVLRLEAYCREFRGSSPEFVSKSGEQAFDEVRRELLQVTVTRAIEDGRAIEFRGDGSVLVGKK